MLDEEPLLEVLPLNCYLFFFLIIKLANPLLGFFWCANSTNTGIFEILLLIGGAGDDGGYSMGLDNQMPVGKIGAKKQRKLEMKEDKRILREVRSVVL